jgi:hypothetical protein
MSFAKDFFRVHQVLIRQKFIFIKLSIEGLDLGVKSKNDPKQQSSLTSYLNLSKKIRLVFRARRETVKKRSIHVVCEHFEPLRNTAMGT